MKRKKKEKEAGIFPFELSRIAKPLAPSVLRTSNPASTRRKTAWKLQLHSKASYLCKSTRVIPESGSSSESFEDKSSLTLRHVRYQWNPPSFQPRRERGWRGTATSLQTETTAFLIVARSKSFEAWIQHRQRRNMLKTIREKRGRIQFILLLLRPSFSMLALRSIFFFSPRLQTLRVFFFRKSLGKW